jgi:hypothetical protein
LARPNADRPTTQVPGHSQQNTPGDKPVEPVRA